MHRGWMLRDPSFHQTTTSNPYLTLVLAVSWNLCISPGVLSKWNYALLILVVYV